MMKSTYLNIFENKNSLTSEFDVILSFAKHAPSKVSRCESNCLPETFVLPRSNNSNPGKCRENSCKVKIYML